MVLKYVLMVNVYGCKDKRTGKWTFITYWLNQAQQIWINLYYTQYSLILWGNPVQLHRIVTDLFLSDVTTPFSSHSWRTALLIFCRMGRSAITCWTQWLWKIVWKKWNDKNLNDDNLDWTALYMLLAITCSISMISRTDYSELDGPRQANLVLTAYASSEGSGEPAHLRSLPRTSAARSYKQWVKRHLQTESQIPSPSEWLGMCS